MRIFEVTEAATRGDIKTASDGHKYRFRGQQWVNINTGRMATKDIAAELGGPKQNAVDIEELGKQIRSQGASMVQQVLTLLNPDKYPANTPQ